LYSKTTGIFSGPGSTGTRNLRLTFFAQHQSASGRPARRPHAEDVNIHVLKIMPQKDARAGPQPWPEITVVGEG
jgi:hypothetical protein